VRKCGLLRKPGQEQFDRQPSAFDNPCKDGLPDYSRVNRTLEAVAAKSPTARYGVSSGKNRHNCLRGAHYCSLSPASIRLAYDDTAAAAFSPTSWPVAKRAGENGSMSLGVLPVAIKSAVHLPAMGAALNP
jgi:hypothetical protein